jgi:hypothetical protein
MMSKGKFPKGKAKQACQNGTDRSRTDDLLRVKKVGHISALFWLVQRGTK